MKISWAEEKKGSTTFHYGTVGDGVRCALVVHMEARSNKPGWQLYLPNHPHGHPSGQASSVKAAKMKAEAAIEDWFERTGLL